MGGGLAFILRTRLDEIVRRATKRVRRRAAPRVQLRAEPIDEWALHERVVGGGVRVKVVVEVVVAEGAVVEAAKGRLSDERIVASRSDRSDAVIVDDVGLRPFRRSVEGRHRVEVREEVVLVVRHVAVGGRRSTGAATPIARIHGRDLNRSAADSTERADGGGAGEDAAVDDGCDGCSWYD